jgi:hypothetical protein
MKVATQIRRSCKRWKGRSGTKLTCHPVYVCQLALLIRFAIAVKDDVTLALDRLSLAFLAIAVKVIPKGRSFALTDVFY